jgi:hypothetical protein
MADEKPTQRSQKKSEGEQDKREPCVAQVGNQKVPRPEKVSGRDVPDDVDE